MAKTRAQRNEVTNKKGKVEKEFTLDDLKFIITSAAKLTVEEMAEKLECSVAKVNDFITTYNSANKHMVHNTFGRRGGAVVMTEGSSAHGDKGSPLSFIKPKTQELNIHRIKKD